MFFSLWFVWNGAAAVDVKGFERENWTPISLFRLSGEESWGTIPPDASGITRRPHRSCVSPLPYQPVVSLLGSTPRRGPTRGCDDHTQYRTELRVQNSSQSVCLLVGWGGAGVFSGWWHSHTHQLGQHNTTGNSVSVCVIVDPS